MDAAQRWGSAEYTHTLGEVSWMASTAVLMHLNERATGDPARDWLSSWAHRYFQGRDLRVLVLGCGEGWLERAISEWTFVRTIDGVDFAEAAVARARERGGPKIRYGVVDLNRHWSRMPTTSSSRIPFFTTSRISNTRSIRSNGR